MTLNFLKTIFVASFLVFLGFLSIISTISPRVSASVSATATPVTREYECDRVNVSNDGAGADIKWWTFTTPTKFLPIIPESCSTQTDGKIRPISLNVIPVIILRAYGFLCALAFYLLTPLFAYNGVMYMYGGISSGKTEEAKKALQNSFLALVILVSFYVIVMGIVGVIADTSTLQSLRLDNFFSF